MKTPFFHKNLQSNIVNHYSLIVYLKSKIVNR